MAKNVFFRVHENKVQEYLMPGQAVNDMVYQTAVDARRIARLAIHNRTGTLARMIQVNRPARYGVYKISSLVFTRTKYALYVHEGTPTIFPKKRKVLTIPKHAQNNGLNFSGSALRQQWRAGGVGTFPAGRPFFTAKSISGQRANPYLRIGMEAALAKQRGLSMT